jgi:Sap, sulfolipid-1-addressing protein
MSVPADTTQEGAHRDGVRKDRDPGDGGRTAVNAAFFGLAFIAALNPKLLAVDLLLIENRRPRLMFACLLLGGMGVAITVGLLDVFVLHADAVKAQGQASAGLDVALGVPLLIIGVLLATGRLHRRRAPASAASAKPAKGDSWAQRVLREPRFGLAILIGAVVGTPGASYITALHQLTTSKTPTATQAIAVVLFTIIEFLLILVPWAFLELRPEGTKAKLKSAQGWLTVHARQLIAWAAIIAGTYMAVSGVVRLS